MQTLSTLTTKQTEILKLLYAYRYLTRPQLQTLLNHKDKRRIISWLKDLRDKQYIDWKYNANDFITKTKPAIYYLSPGGIRHLRATGKYPSTELKKRYKDKDGTDAFIAHCLLMVDCCLALRAKSDETRQYAWLLPSDFMADSEQLDHLELLRELKPHLFFTKREGKTVSHYVVEDFAATLPRYQLRKRLSHYIDLLTNEWTSEEPTPIALFICPTKADLIYIKRRVKMLFQEISSAQPFSLRVATADSVRTNSITGHIWEEVE